MYSLPFLYSESSKQKLLKYHTEKKFGKPRGEGGLGEMEIIGCP